MTRTIAYCASDGARMLNGTNAYGQPMLTCPDCGWIELQPAPVPLEPCSCTLRYDRAPHRPTILCPMAVR